MEEPLLSGDEARFPSGSPVASGGPLLVFGAGSMGREITERLGLAGISVQAFLDNNRHFWHEKVDGLPVLNPAELRDADKATVILASVWAAEMRTQCLSMGVEDIVSMAEAVRRFKLVHAFEEITCGAAVDGLRVWDDDGSRATYRALLRFRATLDLAELPPPMPDTYFTSLAAKPENLRVFVDCGAFTGDTYLQYRQNAGDVYEHYYGFEPDPPTFAVLQRNVSDDPRASVYNQGLGKTSGTVAFYSLSNGVSKIGDGGTARIQIDSLDNVLGSNPVTMIKMDIEGYELEALAGAEKIIRSQRPLLAISCYHQLDHYWRIPLWINGLDLGYRLRLLHHGPSYAESVCYGIPG